jgi:hypothetical protein
MRKISVAAVAMILATAGYFTVFWGFEALRMLTSPNYGLEDAWHSQGIFEIGRLFSLSPIGLIKLAALFATIKLAVAVICAAHIADRLRALAGGKPMPEILEAGLILVMLVTTVSAVSAILAQNIDLGRDQAIQLLLATVGAALCVLERSYARAEEQSPSYP